LKEFLYISPYFPPQSRVGALRPLKFVRHLSQYNWRPVVLTDLSPYDDIDPELDYAVPSDIEVVRNYSKNALKTENLYFSGSFSTDHALEATLTQSVLKKIRKFNALWAGIENCIPKVMLPGPEFVPLGHHSFDIPHAIKASRELLRRGHFRAIVVNADPYASLLVGAYVSREFDVPLVLDFRDPWSVCDVRRKIRLWPQRSLVDRLERWAVETASKVILNTRTALTAYRQHYRDLPADRFTVVHNHADAQLSGSGSFFPPQVFTMLYLGRFRRFVEGHQLLQALAELKRRGYDGTQVQLIVTGDIWLDTRQLVERLDIDDMLVNHPFVGYTQIGSFIKTMDLLISISSQSIQRIPAKFYDYAVSNRPILSISNNPEINQIARDRLVEGMNACPLNDIKAIADAMENEIGFGRRRAVNRRAVGLDSTSAAAEFSAILDEISVS